MDLRVEPMSDVLGARVTGIDLRDGLDDATFAELRRIWLDHLVILLPVQDICTEQQAATGFGVLTPPQDSAPQSDDQPNSLLITNVKDTIRLHSALGYRPPAPETIIPIDQRPAMH